MSAPIGNGSGEQLTPACGPKQRNETSDEMRRRHAFEAWEAVQRCQTRTRASSREEIDTICEEFGESRLKQKERRRGRAITKLLSEVEPEHVSWLWPGYIPLGKVTVLDGDPGLGKSTLTLDLAARTSTGAAMPDGSGGGEPRGVVLMSAEDGLADTIRPRLDAADADTERIVTLSGVSLLRGNRPPDLNDLDAIEEAVRQVDARLVVIDPLMAFLPRDTNSWRDQDVRRILAPLAELAERLEVAIVVVRHLNKASGISAVYRGGGSIGIIGAARSGLLVAADPDDRYRRILVSVKNNLAKAAPAFAFHLEDASDHGCSRVVWEGPTHHTADGVLAAATAKVTGSGHQSAKLDEAVEFLCNCLADGPLPESEVLKGAEAEGLSEGTLKRARKKLGVVSRKVGFGDGWILCLPEDVREVATEEDQHPAKEIKSTGMISFDQPAAANQDTALTSPKEIKSGDMVAFAESTAPSGAPIRTADSDTLPRAPLTTEATNGKPVTRPGQPSDKPDLQTLRDKLWGLGCREDFPWLPYGPHKAIQPGRESWRRWIADAPEDELRSALTRLAVSSSGAS